MFFKKKEIEKPKIKYQRVKKYLLMINIYLINGYSEPKSLHEHVDHKDKETLKTIEKSIIDQYNNKFYIRWCKLYV